MTDKLSPFAFVCALLGGIALACQSGSSPNLNHCFNAEGDQTCADQFGDERPYCARPSESCGGAVEFGCVAEPPSDDCYSPCGGGLLVGEDSGCLGSADGSETGSETDGETGDGDGEPAPVCGDGVVDADEQCDDGNVVDDDECSNACAAAVCGDGVVQAVLGETCDDGNTEGGDACTASCVQAGTVIWSRLYDFDQCRGYGLAVQSDGNIVATAVCDNDGWRVLGVDPDGELLWNNAGLPFARQIAVAANDDVAIGGQINGAQGALRRLNDIGNFLWAKNVQFASSAINALAFDAGGAVIAAGYVGGDRLLQRYSAAGELEWTTQTAGGEQLIALTTNAEGYAWALRLDPFKLETYTPTGELDWESGLLGVSTPLAAVTIDSNENAVVVAQTSAELVSFYLAKYGPTGLPIWTELHDEPGVVEIGYAIAALPNDGLLVAGVTNNDGVNAEADGLLSWYSSGGDLLQDVAFDNDKNNDADFFTNVAVSDEGYAVAVGYHETTGNGHMLWLVKVAI